MYNGKMQLIRLSQHSVDSILYAEDETTAGISHLLIWLSVVAIENTFIDISIVFILKNDNNRSVCRSNADFILFQYSDTIDGST